VIWDKQWELFSPNFKDGKAHIDLTPYGCPQILQLYPGPGFGDLSHPTTRIVLRLMQPYIKDQAVLDIGCGSGILSLAAAAMGASQVDGYDIDPEAVEHAKKNATLNSLKRLLQKLLMLQEMAQQQRLFLLKQSILKVSRASLLELILSALNVASTKQLLKFAKR